MVTMETRRHGGLLQEETTEVILGAAIDVDGTLGPGLIECALVLRKIL
jgi:hypothetical protein